MSQRQQIEMDTQNTLGLDEEYFKLQEISIHNAKEFLNLGINLSY